MLVKVAMTYSLTKEAGLLSDTGSLISKTLFDSGQKNLAHLSQMNVSDALKGAGSSVKNALTPLKVADKAAQFTHVLKDGSKITADQFAKLGPNAKMYAKPLV